MQAEPDSNKGDVEGINFRPSTNFKHMKKYRKGAATGGGSSAGEGEASGSRSEEERGECQPPLPRDPPPPESPPLTLKTEVEDEDYMRDSDEPAAEPEPDKGKQSTPCRDFKRGACLRGDSCRFRHEPTFCVDFQNKKTCNYPRCRFVHATIFEKEHYYRTGYLPPHATAHIPTPDIAKATPSPAKKCPTTERAGFQYAVKLGGQAEASTSSGVPQLPGVPPPTGGPVIHPGVSGAVGGVAEAHPVADALAATAAIPGLKRDWQDVDEQGAAAVRATARAPEPNKCRHCDHSVYRLQCSKTKLEVAKRSSQEMDRKMAIINNKLAKQRLILNSVMRHSDPAPAQVKTILEKLNLLLRNGHSAPVEEPSKSLETVLMRWLLSSGETPPTPGAPPGPDPGPSTSR